MVTLLSSEMSPQFAKWLNFPLHPVWPCQYAVGEEQLMGFVLDAMRQRGGPIYTPSDLFCFVLPTLICELGKFSRLCIWHLTSRFKWLAVLFVGHMFKSDREQFALYYFHKQHKKYWILLVYILYIYKVRSKNIYIYVYILTALL